VQQVVLHRAATPTLVSVPLHCIPRVTESKSLYFLTVSLIVHGMMYSDIVTDDPVGCAKLPSQNCPGCP
jgi:hypothetical protein